MTDLIERMRRYAAEPWAHQDNWHDLMLEAAERLAELERQLAEARAVIVFDRHPDSDFTWKRPPFYAAAVEAAHAASRQHEKPTP